MPKADLSVVEGKEAVIEKINELTRQAVSEGKKSAL